MIDIRKFDTLGHADHGWLDARHHFSFANYHDEDRMGWGALRVWNDDAIAAQSGFPPHPHRDMEIITYVRTGAITHRDSMGNSGRTAAGDVQVMSAGTGVTHSEFNLEDEKTTLFQIWIMPDQSGGNPGQLQRAARTLYAQKSEARLKWPKDIQRMTVNRYLALSASTTHDTGCWSSRGFSFALPN